jgi:hypothetical protein
VSGLRAQLAVARGRPALRETFVPGRDRLVRVTTALTAVFVCVVLAKRVSRRSGARGLGTFDADTTN